MPTCRTEYIALGISLGRISSKLDRKRLLYRSSAISIGSILGPHGTGYRPDSCMIQNSAFSPHHFCVMSQALMAAKGPRKTWRRRQTCRALEKRQPRKYTVPELSRRILRAGLAFTAKLELANPGGDGSVPQSPGVISSCESLCCSSGLGDCAATKEMPQALLSHCMNSSAPVY